MKTPHGEFETLVTAFIEGSPNTDQRARLSELLLSDGALRTEYVRQMRLDALLKFTAHGSGQASGAPTRLPNHKRGSLLKPAYRAAVLAVCGALTALWLMTRGVPLDTLSIKPYSDAPETKITRSRLSRLKIDTGEAFIRMPSGVQLDMLAPLEVRFLSPNHIRVLQGRVTVDVGERGKGFVMDTPHTRVVDLGTRFGVDASQSAHTDVVVFKGKVELYREDEKSRIATLNQGEGVRVEAARRMSRIVSLSGLDDSDSWIQSEKSGSRPTISAVGDNLSGHQPSLRNFYRIVPSGLRNGSRAFADEEDRWEEVPAALVGADLVRTFAIDAYNWWLTVSIQIDRPSEVFVFVDARNPLPGWLDPEFTDTGETIALDFIPSQTPGRVAKRLQYAIWKRAVLTPGTIQLGAPYANPPEDRKSFKPNRMYGIAARPIQ